MEQHELIIVVADKAHHFCLDGGELILTGVYSDGRRLHPVDDAEQEAWQAARGWAAKENEAALAALEDLSEPLEPGAEGEELAELRPVEALPGHTAPTALDHLVRVFGTAAAELDGDVLAVPTGEGLARYRAAEAAEILARFVDGFGAASWDRRDRVWEALSACRVEPEPWGRPAREIALKAWRRIYEAQADLMGALVGVPGAFEADGVEARRLEILAGKLEAVVREARALRRLSAQDEESQGNAVCRLAGRSIKRQKDERPSLRRF